MLRNLKTLRQKARISQQALAKVIGVSQQSINQYENQGVEPDVSVLIRIANFFDTSIDYLVGRDFEEGEGYIICRDIDTHEKDILDKYRILPDREKVLLDELIDIMISSVGAKGRKRSNKAQDTVE